MAPRKAAAKSTTEPKCATLKLHIEKGPLSGQISDFLPGSVVRIGRVVRGNTLSIKEDGISSKHLVIKLDDDSQQHWTITDLDSSNGTFLNSQRLTPREPLVLSNNDEIKIGEMTAIHVTLEMIAGESIQVKRNTRGRGKNLGVIPEDKAAVVVGNEVDAEMGNDLNVVAPKVSVRRTRSSKNADVEGSEIVSVRRTRSSVKEKEQLVELGVIEGKIKKKGGRGKANVQAEKIVEEEVNVGHGSDNVIDGVETRKEGECGTVGASGVEKGETGTRKGQLLVDLETMTLGEWFDFLEDYLPKQIVDATEEVISDMKEKAKRLHDYKLLQMKAKK